MINREPFKLLWVTAVHNLLLCAESLFMFVVGIYVVWLKYNNEPLSELFCTNSRATTDGLFSWIMYMYYLSKFPELLDTVILVLKKKNVIFLHWYHHAIVMLMVWAWMEFNIPFGIFGLILNTGIHVLMYWYYFASSFGWNVWYKKYITTAQIIQFILSFVMSIPYIYYAKVNNCGGWNAYYFSMAVSGSFLMLFINFYRTSYGKKPKAEKKDPKETKKNYSPSASPRAKRTPKKK
ncbi:hypothetical protein HK103_004200 [Boothiomyces macroporosus]|uniref:Elongation of fatty acids protein n=1 Tax=Boothiomyces macroporosus TaxID=261099 RepID=A0AAD5UJI3_9FUNG|nr:hypothetical protein HK103_004200 [Boothiomyces macroporosus]